MESIFLQFFIFNESQNLSDETRNQVRTSNGLAGILALASVFAILVNLYIQSYQRVLIYCAIDMVFLMVFCLNYRGNYLAARLILAYFPGLFLFSAAFSNNGLVHGDRQGYFYSLIIISMIPLLLFSDGRSKLLFYTGIVFYSVLIALFDLAFTFTDYATHITLSTKLKELIFYGAISAAFAWKINQKTRVELLLNNRNADLVKKNSEIEKLLDEVKLQKEEVSIQQELLHVQNDQLTRQRDDLTSINGRLEKNNKALLELASNTRLTNGNYEDALKLITRLASRTLNISRVSIWEIVKNGEVIICKDLYSLETDEHTCAMELNSQDYPTYFKSIRANKTLVAEDAVHNMYTEEFNDTYLMPLQIKSMMDTPYFIDGKIHGIVCFEHQKEIHKWTHEDVLFSRAIADVVPLAHQSMETKQAQLMIIEQNETLLRKQLEISELNEHLEEKVKFRTTELEIRNKQLEDMAFFNGHVLRAPLCSLQGLLAVGELDEKVRISEDYNHYLKASLEQLEEVTRQMSERLNNLG